ncbi:signal peptidase I [Verrucomicrobiota bacterium]
MHFFKRRQLKEEVKNVLKDARHARNMREDICPEELLQKMADAVHRVEVLWKEKADAKKVRDAIHALHHVSCRVYPPHPQPKWHENIEVLVVALGAAMAIRAYFVQPFKIPTGSMQPTLNGILHEEHEPNLSDKFPLSIGKWLITGESFKPATSMLKIAGDHVIVNKFLYNFVPPKRGDVVVFDTAGINKKERANIIMAQLIGNGRVLDTIEFIEHGQTLIDRATARPIQQILNEYAQRYQTSVRAVPVSQRKGIALTYYIKRMVGEPGDEISVDNGYLVANGEKVTEPFPFERQVNEYGGYTYAGKIMDSSNSIKLADDEFLPFGDNSANSLDGRYFGGVKCDRLLGPAFMVYWPLGQHWGAIR